MTKEDRKNLRISCSVPVLMRFNDAVPSEGWGIIYDISLGGIKIETRRRVEKGDIVFSSFVLTDNYIFQNTRGKVVRVAKQGAYYTVGVAFELIVDRNHLLDALHSMLEA